MATPRVSLPLLKASWLPSALEESSAFVRLWLGFMTARVTLAAALLGLLYALRLLAPAPGIPTWLIALYAAYLAATLAVRLLARPQPPGPAFHPYWVFTVGVDVLAFSTLQVLQPGGLNYSALLALPVLMGSVLGTRLLALGTAAGVALLLLGDAALGFIDVPGDAAPRLAQTGLACVGYFLLAVLTHQLASRLAGEERAARQNRRAARTQAEVNELIIENLADGVVVVDRSYRIHAVNPAAGRLLGRADTAPLPVGLTEEPAWRPLADIAQRTFETGEAQKIDLAIATPGHEQRRLAVRTRLTRDDAAASGLCVLFLDDLREVEARLRTEKLAAMGRMSAAVAHEIRNPLAAIAQANALLEEDLQESGQRQLSALIRQNTQRLVRTVEDILNLSRGYPLGAQDLLALDAAVGAACDDWSMHHPAAARLERALDSGAHVLFESEHLRRLLVNLLDNAARYASTTAGAIRVSSGYEDDRPVLRVWSDGAALARGVEQRLFEPFFSSESRSSGLGLYICRELCKQHGASIAYRRVNGPHNREGNEFFVVFSKAEAQLTGRLPK